MDNDTTTPKEDITQEDTLRNESPEDELLLSIEKALYSEFIEGENLIRRSYIPEAMRLRDLFDRAREQNPHDRIAILGIVEQSLLLQRRNEIVNARIDKDQLMQMAALNTKLRQDPHLLQTLRNALYSFQYSRLNALHVDQSAITQQIEHIQRVVTYVEQANDPPPLAVLAAAVHDIEKVANVSYIDKTSPTKDKHFLAEHEYMSAALGSEVVGHALRAAGLEEYANAAAILIGKAVLPHGEGEWPELQAEKGVLPMTYPLNDTNKELFLLLGGLFIKSPRSAEIPIVHHSVDTNDHEIEAAAAEMRVTAEAVSAADKMDGLGDKSFVKYHIGNTLSTIFSRSSSYDYATSFVETMVKNMRNAPDVLDIKRNPQIEGVIHRAGLCMSIMEDVQNHPVLNALQIAAGDPVPDFLPPYSEGLGSEVAKGLVITALEMRALFEDAKKQWDRTNERAQKDDTNHVDQAAILADRDRAAGISKQMYQEKMEELIDDIIALGDPYNAHPNLAGKIDNTLAVLQSMYP